MSGLEAEGFRSSRVMEELAVVLARLSQREQKAEITKTNAIFEIQLKNISGTEQSWTIDLKEGTGPAVSKGSATKVDATLIMDATFVEIASGELEFQKAYLTGKLKIKGNVILGSKLEHVLKIGQHKEHT
ncbi:hypothetical protein FRB94_002397 [Tulasnella sp. JGI-2019a]|nr:hypothetical protein FRB94_002397 [Tulasnella sp. JGI-2019a]